MNKPFGKAREGSYIFQFDTSLWSHNVELFGRTLFLFFSSFFSLFFVIFYPSSFPDLHRAVPNNPGAKQVNSRSEVKA